jgi:Uma2 family endonuclease
MASAAAGSASPDLDERLVEPETRYEMLDGELIYVAPADPPHAERHVQLCALLEAHTGPGFEVACDLLTRTSKVDDFAPDASVYPADPDLTTGRRQLEQLAFEIVSAQSMRVAARKAAKLAARGVRRIFAIDVERSRVLEWAAVPGRWTTLDAAGHIADAALAVALPIVSLIHTVKVDDDLARALVIKRNPVIEAIRADDRAQAKAETLVAILAARGQLDEPRRVGILAERDLARIERWISRAIAGASIGEIFAEP